LKRSLLVLMARHIGSRPARGAWIETTKLCIYFVQPLSRPARGAWIETCEIGLTLFYSVVAPRAGRVD